MMRKSMNAIRHSLLSYLQIPGYIRQEFLHESKRKNDVSLHIICVVIFVIEFYNLARVLLWSKSGLGTQNNRIYFSMYCTLILLGVLWLLLRRPLRQASVRCQCAVQYTVSGLILLWHLGLNSYDLIRDPAAGVTVLTTALLALALLIQMPPWYSIVQYVISYLLFQLIMAPLLDGGSRLNLTITFVVALTVSLAQAHHTSVTLKQQKQIIEINAKLQALVHLDPLTGLLNKITVECRAEQLLLDLGQTARPSGLTLFLLDLDRFKTINDRYGHPCGDHVLVETAEAIRRAFPDPAGLGRIGGDEFAVLYDQPLTEEQAMFLGQEFMAELRSIQWQGQPIEVQCSIGVCICTLPQSSYQDLYTETDRMLYQAKKSGRGQCCVLKLKAPENREIEMAGAKE